MTTEALNEAMALHTKVQSLQDKRNALLAPWLDGGPDLSPEQWEQVRQNETELRHLLVELDRRVRELI